MTSDVIQISADNDRVHVTTDGADIVSVGIQGPPGATGSTGPTGPGVPAGGTTGQFLRKVDGVDYNTAWDTLGADDLPSHTHSASDIIAGQLGLARGGTGADLSATGGSGHVVMQESVAGVFTVRALLSSDIPSLAASKITSGEFDVAQIPDLATSKITSGVLDNARVNWEAPGAHGSVTPNSGAFTVITSSGDVRFGAAGASAARLNVNAGASQVGAIVRSNATGSANIQEWQASNGVAVAFVNSAGDISAQRFLTDTLRDLGGTTYWTLGGTNPNRALTIGNTGNLLTLTIQTKSAGLIALAPSSGNVAIGSSAATSKLDVTGDIEVRTTDAIYFGDPTTNGSGRIRFDSGGGAFVFEQRILGTWTAI